MDSISVTVLQDRVTEDNPITLLDVREQWEFNNCRINGSINIPMSEISSRINDIDRDADMVVICHHGGRSAQVVYYLQQSGFENRIYNLEGGIDAWAREIEPTMPRY